MKRKVKKLAQEIFATAQQKFPEIQFVGIQEHPEQHDRFWINVSGPIDEEQEMEMNMFVNKISMRILIDEGYSFGIMLRAPHLEVV